MSVMVGDWVNFLNIGLRQLFRWVRGLVLIFCCVLMTGCVDYQLAVQLDSPHSGEITQHIQLSNQANPTAQALLTHLQRQTRSVQGNYKTLSPKEVDVVIPFHTVKELEEKFNRFFAGDLNNPDIPPVVSNLKVSQQNALLFEHDRLVFDIDLTALGLQGIEEIADSSGLFNLSLNVNGQTWPLKAGQKTHVDTDFWLAMPLGWGALAIVGLVIGGNYIRLKN